MTSNMIGPVWTQQQLNQSDFAQPAVIPYVSSSSDSDCASQRTRSTVTLLTSSSIGSAIISDDAEGTEKSKMQSFDSGDSAETDDEIVNILQYPHQRVGQAPIGSRYHTPRIANRKVITEDADGDMSDGLNSAFDAGAPPSFAHHMSVQHGNGQDNGNADFFATGFSPTEFDFQRDEFDFQTKDFHCSLTSRMESCQVKENEDFHHGFNQAPIVHEASDDGNSLNPDDCRSLDINEINDLVNASPSNLKHEMNAFRYHRHGDNPSASIHSDHPSELHSEVSSYMDLTHGETSTAMSTTVKSLHSSPQSVIELDSAQDSSSYKKSRRKKLAGRKLNTISYSKASHTRDSSDDDSLSFVSRRHRTRIRVGKISDRGSSARKKDVSVVDKIVNSSPMAKLHEFITGNALCCTTRGQPLIGECNPDDEEDGDDEYEYQKNGKKYKDCDETSCDDGTYDDDLTDYNDNDEDTKSYASSHYRYKRGGSAVSVESSYYTTDDDDTVSRASTRSRQSSHHYRGNSYNAPVKKSLQPMQDIVQQKMSPRSSPVRGRSLSRGLPPTIRNGYNSDRFPPRGGSSGSFNSNQKHVQGTEIKGCDSIADMSVAESVLSQDQAVWMAMTEAFPERVGQVNSTISGQTVVSEPLLSAGDVPTSEHSIVASLESSLPEAENDVSMNSTQSNFAKVTMLSSATIDDCCKAVNDDKNPSLSKTASKIPAEVDGYFKKLLSIGIRLQLNDPPSANSTHCRKRQGKLLLRFGGHIDANFESPFFIWKDMNEQPSSFSAPEATNKTESILMSDIQTIRKPRGTELVSYPLVTPDHCFVLSTRSGITLLLEAIDGVQMVRVTTGLNGIIDKLERDINAGDNTWIMQSLASVRRTARDVQLCVGKKDAGVKKTLLQEAVARRMRRRQQR